MELQSKFEFPENWKRFQLEEIVNVRRDSVNPLQLDIEFVELYSLPGFDDDKKIEKIRPQEIGSNKYQITKDAVLFSKLNPEKKRVWLVQNFVKSVQLCSTEFWPIEGDLRKVNNEYLYHLFLSDSFINHPFISPASSTNSHKRVDLRSFKRVTFLFPPLSEQVKIAAILSSVDEAIDKTSVVIQKTELLKKGLMQVLLTMGMPGWHSEYKETKLGAIPKCWEITSLEHIVIDDNGAIRSGPFGSTLLHSEFQETGIPVLGIDNVQMGSFGWKEKRYISEKKYRELEKYTVRPCDVLITIMASLGRTCVVPRDIGTAIISKHIYRISCNKEIFDPWLLMYILSSYIPVTKLIFGGSQGGTRPGINKSILLGLKFPKPSIEEQEKIVKIIRSTEKSMKKLDDELVELNSVKKGLMQQLLKGKIRVNA